MRRTSPDPRDGHGGVDCAPSTAWELSIDSNRTTRAQVFHIPHHREGTLQQDVASMAWVCRGRSGTGFICKARGRRAAGASTCDGLREAAPVARGCAVRLRAALRVQSLFRRARKDVTLSPSRTTSPRHAPRRAGGTSAHRRARRDGRIADARRAAGAGRRGGSLRPRSQRFRGRLPRA